MQSFSSPTLAINEARDATFEWHHTLLTGLCQCPLPPRTIRSTVCEWYTPRPGHSHPIEEWETLSLGCHLPRHVCPFLPAKCNQCSWSSGSFGGNRKKKCLDSAYSFTPIAIELSGACGPLALQFLRDLGNCLKLTREENSFRHLL